MRCRFLFCCEIGDPVSSVFLGDEGCMAGTMFGKVWLHTFADNHTEQLAAFSDEGVRGLYLDSEAATVSFNESLRGWRVRERCHEQRFASTGSLNFRALDKRNSQNVKYMLQRGVRACVVFQVSSVEINVSLREHEQRNFKLFAYGSVSDLTPCDYDGSRLLVIDRNPPQRTKGPSVRLVHLASEETLDLEELPCAEGLTLIRLYRDTSLAYTVGGTAFVYDFAESRVAVEFKGVHRGEIVGIDASNEELIVTVGADSLVAIWSGWTGELKQSFRIREANFFMGFPYHVSLHGHRVLFSADEGVFMAELDEDPAGVGPHKV